jgi:crotonobetainyl-CoA:carnitine CoA-transferase CaiB-like acyl-CoA transferase
MSTSGAPGGTELVDPGILVLELGERVAAGICGSLLADLGADVVLGDSLEREGFKWCNRSAIAAGKRSVAQSGIDPGGSVEALLDQADVLLLSSDVAAGQLEIWERSRPVGQIVCDITGFGHSGPLAGQGLPEALVDAYAGITATNGERSGPPVTTGAPVLEMETAVYAASAVLAAIRVKRMHGFGQRLDIATYDVGVNALATFIPNVLVGRPASRNGNRHPASSPWNSYAASDGTVVICAPYDDQWARLCDAMGAPELAQDPRFATTTARLENEREIDAVIAGWVAPRTMAECQAALEARVVPAGPIVAFDELPGEPNIVHRGSMVEAWDPELGRSVHVMPSPVRVENGSRGPVSIPAFDAHRAEIAGSLSRRSDRGEFISGDLKSPVRPLAGVRVIEIGSNTVAPLAARQLGALGADVIKIEPPAGDTNRSTPPLRQGGGSFIYAISNTNKRGLVLNLKDDGDAESLRRLLGSADVLVENLKPGSLDRLGFGSEGVRRLNPSLIYCSINGFGHDSAYPGRPALDTVIQATSGVMSTTIAAGVATKTGLSLADQLGGQFGLLSILAALDRRDRTGEGATLDLAMHDCAAWATQMVWNDSKRPQSAVVARNGGFVAEAGGHTAPVLGVAEVLGHEQTRGRGLIRHETAADGEDWLVLGSPMRLLSTPAEVGAPMPRLGFIDPDLALQMEVRPS